MGGYEGGTYWRDKASERQRKINRLEREMKILYDRLQARDIELAQAQDRLSGVAWSHSMRKELDAANKRAGELVVKLSRATTRNIELGREIETLRASLGDLDARDASIHVERRRGPYERRVSPVEDRRSERDARWGHG